MGEMSTPDTAPNAPETADAALGLVLWLSTTVNDKAEADDLAVALVEFLAIIGWQIVRKADDLPGVV
jgi:hypothetical protein